MQTSLDCQLPLFLLTRPSGTPYTTISKNHAMIVIEDLKVTCQSQQRVRSASRGAMFGQNQVETVRYWIRASMKCAVSLSTNSSGVAVRCLLFRQRTQASVARTVVIQRKKTASSPTPGYPAEALAHGNDCL